MRTLLSFLRPWTMWTDILVFNYAGESHVLQGRRNVRTGRCQFAVRNTKQWWRFSDCEDLTEKALRRAGLWNAPDIEQP